MTDRIPQVRRRGTAREVFGPADDRSMRLLELVLAFTAMGAAVLLTVVRG